MSRRGAHFTHSGTPMLFVQHATCHDIIPQLPLLHHVLNFFIVGKEAFPPSVRFYGNGYMKKTTEKG
jgi:hypothetical protein